MDGEVPAHPMACTGKWQSGRGMLCPMASPMPVPPGGSCPGSLGRAGFHSRHPARAGLLEGTLGRPTVHPWVGQAAPWFLCTHHTAHCHQHAAGWVSGGRAAASPLRLSRDRGTAGRSLEGFMAAVGSFSPMTHPKQGRSDLFPFIWLEKLDGAPESLGWRCMLQGCRGSNSISTGKSFCMGSAPFFKL